MEANTRTLKDILNPEQRFAIPTFQGDYEWTKTGQWKLLCQDLKETATRLIEKRPEANSERFCTN